MLDPLIKTFFKYLNDNSKQITLFSQVFVRIIFREETKDAFLLGDLDQVQPSQISLDHDASKEPVNLWPEWIRRFL